MGEIYRGVVSESEAWSTSCRPSSRIARRRRMEIRRLKFVAGVASTETGADGMGTHKKQKLQVYSSTRSGTDSSPCSRDCQNAVENCGAEQSDVNKPFEKGKSSENIISSQYSLKPTSSPSILSTSSYRSRPVSEIRGDFGLWKEKRHGRCGSDSPFILSERPGNHNWAALLWCLRWPRLLSRGGKV
ncbi:hypothetical protein OIU79_027851 [Salix purpurea]|uniref:Uncharacterized protein n=1 Tax=Salix purpurea TaxID=77065 RepID=A0A9Q0VXH4_SALPP|nr:hypothetical protein OIU79_027851 [Salix purpurea]